MLNNNNNNKYCIKTKADKIQTQTNKNTHIQRNTARERETHIYIVQFLSTVAVGDDGDDDDD